MHIFLALRRDVAVSFRQSAQQLWNVRDYFAAVPCRLETAPVGSPAPKDMIAFAGLVPTYRDEAP